MAPQLIRRQVLPTLVTDIIDPTESEPELPSPSASTPTPEEPSGTPSSSPTSTRSGTSTTDEAPTPQPTPRTTSTSSSTTNTPSPRPSPSASSEDEDSEVVTGLETTSTDVEDAETLESTPTTDLQTISTTIVENRTVTTSVSPTLPAAANVGATADNSFLDNKVLSGVVFGLSGLVGLIIIITLIFFATRKARRNRQLEQEIISWDPDHGSGFHARRDDNDTNSIEALEEKRRSPSSLDGHHTYTLPNDMVGANLARAPTAGSYRPPHRIQVPPRSHDGHQPYNGQTYPAYHNW